MKCGYIQTIRLYVDMQTYNTTSNYTLSNQYRAYTTNYKYSEPRC